MDLHWLFGLKHHFFQIPSLNTSCVSKSAFHIIFIWISGLQKKGETDKKETQLLSPDSQCKGLVRPKARNPGLQLTPVELAGWFPGTKPSVYIIFSSLLKHISNDKSGTCRAWTSTHLVLCCCRSCVTWCDTLFISTSFLISEIES